MRFMALSKSTLICPAQDNNIICPYLESFVVDLNLVLIIFIFENLRSAEAELQIDNVHKPFNAKYTFGKV